MSDKQLQNSFTTEYKQWLNEIKQKFQSSQIKASIQVNSTLLEFYWNLGSEIVEKQKNSTWGSGFLKQLSDDLSAEFSDLKGFSKRNLELIRKWFLFWQQAVGELESTKSQKLVGKLKIANTKQVVSQLENSKEKQLVSQILQIPWGHNVAIIQKCKNMQEALYYVQNTIKNGISRSVLIHQIETNLYARDGKAITNFEATEFKPEFAGKLSFYTSAVDGEIKEKNDNPTIGILICKSKNDLVVEYALKDINKPLGISQYELTEILPKEYKSSLPSIEEIEAQFQNEDFKVVGDE